MKVKAIFSILCVSFLIAGCASMTVNYNYDQRVSFAALRTFNWLPTPPKSEVNQLTIRNIEFAVDKRLQAKGLRMSEENPDFLIAVHVTKQTKVDTEEWGYAYGSGNFFRGGPYGRFGGGAPANYDFRRGVDTYVYDIGTLIIDFVDPKTRELIWRGTATAEIDPSAPQIEQINNAVAKVLQNYPPPPQR
jgi:hypothetical protein